MASIYYKGAIWTNHAVDRLKERGLTLDIAASVFQNPDKSSPGKDYTIRYQKLINKSQVTIVAKQNEKNEWIILSTWANPPLPGSIELKKRNAIKNYHKYSLWKKFIITAYHQITGSKY